MDKTALITGASSGLGVEFARILASKGYNLVLVARRKDKLQELADHLIKEFIIKVRVLPADLSDPKTPEFIYKTLQKEKIYIDILINNAGFGTHGKFSELDLQGELDEVQVNLTSIVHLTRLFLPDMIEKGSGRILNVASTAAFLPGPFMAVYYASKAFVLSFSEALSEELRGSGVTVTVVCPGPTKTEFARAAKVRRIPLFQHFVMNAPDVASRALNGMFQGKSLVIVGKRNEVQVALGRHLPSTTLARLARRFQELKK